MWVFLNDAFLSIVQPKDAVGLLLVRSRKKGHIQSVFADAHVIEAPKADYLYRAFLPRAVVAATIAQRLMKLDYGNFKNSIKDDRYHDACANVWGVMNEYQHDEQKRDGKT